MLTVSVRLPRAARPGRHRYIAAVFADSAAAIAVVVRPQRRVPFAAPPSPPSVAVVARRAVAATIACRATAATVAAAVASHRRRHRRLPRHRLGFRRRFRHRRRHRPPHPTLSRRRRVSPPPAPPPAAPTPPSSPLSSPLYRRCCRLPRRRRRRRRRLYRRTPSSSPDAATAAVFRRRCCGAPARDAARTRQPRRCVFCCHAIRTRRGMPPSALLLPRNHHFALTFLMCMHARLRSDSRTFFRRDGWSAAMRRAGACSVRVRFERAVARRRPPPFASALPISSPSIHPMFDAPLMGPCQAFPTRLHASSLTHNPLSAQASSRTSCVGKQAVSDGGRKATDRSERPISWLGMMAAYRGRYSSGRCSCKNAFSRHCGCVCARSVRASAIPDPCAHVGMRGVCVRDRPKSTCPPPSNTSLVVLQYTLEQTCNELEAMSMSLDSTDSQQAPSEWSPGYARP